MDRVYSFFTVFLDRSPVSCTDITEKAVQENTEEINIYKTLEQGAREKTPEIIDESRKDIVFEDRRKKIEKPYIIDESPIAETLPNFEVSAKVNKIMTDSIYDGSVPSTDGESVNCILDVLFGIRNFGRAVIKFILISRKLDA